MIDTSNMQLEFDYDSDEIEDIKRCLVTLYATKEGSQPLDRDFGLSYDFVGYPMDVAENMFTLEVMEKTEQYEPRVEVDSVEFTLDSESGAMKPVIRLVKGDEEDG